MAIQLSIRNTAPEGSPSRVTVAVVAPGDREGIGETKHVLAAGQALDLELQSGQFAMVDETDSDT